MKRHDIGVIGLAVMGKNLALNMESAGFSVAAYSWAKEETDRLAQETQTKHMTPFYELDKFVQSLNTPRKVLLMVRAGTPVDEVIDALLPHLEPNDILIDGGNSFFKDTQRRSERLKQHHVHFIGAGVSGGEEGALNGPSIMPGGDRLAHQHVQSLFEAIAAKVNGEPCTTYIGPDGAGHFVKMVHNGIEYGDMQLISEVYFLMKHVIGLNAADLHHVFAKWNEGELNSYLIEITANIFTRVDEETEQPLVELILDTAEQKGTGMWTSQAALELGVALPIITESVFARFMSALKEERVRASTILTGPECKTVQGNKEEWIEAIRKALYMSKICSYAQGFAQLRAASDHYNWNLNYGNIAMIFRGGCIIRAAFLDNIKAAFDRDPHLTNLLLDSYFSDIVNKYEVSLRQVVSLAIRNGIPVPGLTAALAYFDSYRSATLPANLLQAQRDYFGAHTYKRIDKEGIFHTEWLE